MSDYSVLSRLNVRRFEFYFEQLPRPVASAVLKNFSCILFNFHRYEAFEDDPFEANYGKRANVMTSHIAVKKKSQKPVLLWPMLLGQHQRSELLFIKTIHLNSLSPSQGLL